MYCISKSMMKHHQPKKKNGLEIGLPLIYLFMVIGSACYFEFIVECTSPPDCVHS